jgi:hypothetical protein
MEEMFRRIIREELERMFRLRAEERDERSGDQLAPSPLLGVTAAAAMFGLSAKTITRWRNEKKITRYGEGRLARVDPAEVRRLMQAETGAEKRGPTDDDLRALLARKVG